MGTRNTVIGTTATQNRSSEASGKHQGLHRPGDDQRVRQVLDHVGLEDRGELVEDELRDRRGSGVPVVDVDMGEDSGRTRP